MSYFGLDHLPKVKYTVPRVIAPGSTSKCLELTTSGRGELLGFKVRTMNQTNNRLNGQLVLTDDNGNELARKGFLGTHELQLDLKEPKVISKAVDETFIINFELDEKSSTNLLRKSVFGVER